MDESSSTSSSEKSGRAVATWALALLVLTTWAGAELWLYEYFEEPTTMMEQVQRYTDTVAGQREHVVVFGTCLGQAIQDDVATQAWGTGAEVVNLSAEGSTPLDWYLVISRYMEEDPHLKAVVLAGIGSDLTLVSSPWSTQTMELVSWSDMDLLLRTSCRTPGCAVEMVLRRLSRLYRYRGFLGNRFWDGAGVTRPGTVTIKETSTHPMAFRGVLLEPPAGSIYEAPPPPPAADELPPPPEEVGPIEEPKETAWDQEDSWLDRPDDELFWVKELVRVANTRDVEVLLLETPRNPGYANNMDLDWIYNELEEAGARVIDAESLGTRLKPRHYNDHVHIYPTFWDIPGQWFGEWLREHYPE